MTSHLLDASEGWAGDLVAAERRVDADEDAGLVLYISLVFGDFSIYVTILTSLIL